MANGSKQTIADIAEALGVSKTTVSRTLSGKGRIGTETKERILKYIDEHGYVPNALAKGLAKSRTYNIGIAVPEDFALTDLPFFQKCLMGICERSGASDYDVVVSIVKSDEISQLERLINNNKVDGVLLARTFTEDLPAEFLKSRKIPFVAIGSSDDDEIIQVDHDHVTACRELTKMLYKKTGIIPVLLCGNMTHMVTRSRLQGYKEAMQELGLEITDKLISYDADGPAAEAVIASVVDDDNRCILCMDDSICVKALDRLKAAGKHIQKEVHIASFYSSSVLERNVPQITSLMFDDKELGRKACDTLLRLIDGEEVPKKTYMGYRLIG